MSQKLKERIIDWVKKYDVKGFDWKGVSLALGVPQGSATGRLCELTKAGVLERTGKTYRLANDPFVGVRAPQQVKTKTSYFLLLDASTSMSGDNYPNYEDRRPKAADLANDTINEVRKHGQDDDFTIGFFAGSAWWPHLPGGQVSKNYETRNTGTALCRALIEAINKAKQVNNPKVVLCFTDGEENQNYDWAGLKQVIRTAPNDLTVAILVPKDSTGHKELLAAGLPEGNIRPWATMEEARSETVASTAKFVEQRKRGVRSVKNYFRADLSRVTMTDFERDLKEITPQIRRWNTSKETTIEDLIRAKSGTYVVGTGFFEVSKREGRIKEDRKFLIMEPTTGRVFADGRRSVREVCGYPAQGDLAIKPGNHAGYVLLCQSKSSTADTFRARILPRGTNVVLWPSGR